MLALQPKRYVLVAIVYLNVEDWPNCNSSLPLPLPLPLLYSQLGQTISHRLLVHVLMLQWCLHPDCKLKVIVNNWHHNPHANYRLQFYRTSFILFRSCILLEPYYFSNIQLCFESMTIVPLETMQNGSYIPVQAWTDTRTTLIMGDPIQLKKNKKPKIATGPMQLRNKNEKKPKILTNACPPRNIVAAAVASWRCGCRLCFVTPLLLSLLLRSFFPRTLPPLLFFLLFHRFFSFFFLFHHFLLFLLPPLPPFFLLFLQPPFLLLFFFFLSEMSMCVPRHQY